MLALIMNILLWLSCFTGSNALTGNANPGTGMGLKTSPAQSVKGNVPGGVVKPYVSLQLKSTIVLEDDTHFKPFFGLRK